jgi:hypothetical protein
VLQTESAPKDGGLPRRTASASSCRAALPKRRDEMRWPGWMGAQGRHVRASWPVGLGLRARSWLANAAHLDSLSLLNGSVGEESNRRRMRSDCFLDSRESHAHVNRAMSDSRIAKNGRAATFLDESRQSARPPIPALSLAPGWPLGVGQGGAAPWASR